MCEERDAKGKLEREGHYGKRKKERERGEIEMGRKRVRVRERERERENLAGTLKVSVLECVMGVGAWIIDMGC